MNRFVLMALVLGSLSGAAPGFAQDAPRGSGGGGGSARQPLLAGDLIRLNFWLDQELSGDYAIDESGETVLPLLGIRPTAGLEPLVLKQKLRREYDGVLRNQDVQILLLRRIRVLGEVGKPGLYHAELGMTVGDVLAMAEGVDENGNQDDIQLIRSGMVVSSGLNPATLVGAGLESGDQVFVPEKSWFSRNANVVLGTAASITVALIYRGFSR